MSMVEREGDFIVACDVCGEQLEPKMNEKQLTEADKKMEVFNNAMAPIRKSLQRVEKIEFDRRVGSFRATPFFSRTSPGTDDTSPGRFEPINWLLHHVPETIIVERDAKDRRVYVPWEKRKDRNEPYLTPEEKQAKIDAEIARKIEIEQQVQFAATRVTHAGVLIRARLTRFFSSPIGTNRSCQPGRFNRPSRVNRPNWVSSTTSCNR